MDVPLTILKTADHPLIHSFPSFEWSAMGTRSDKEAQLIRGAVETKPPAGFLIDEPCSGGCEIVTIGRQDEPGGGGGQLDVTPHIEPAEKNVGWAHLRIGVWARKQQPIRIDKAGGRDSLDPRVQSAGEGSQR